MTDSKRSGSQSGFTLIELLVSVLLMGLIVSALGAGLSTIAKGWERHSADLANQDMVLRAQAQLLRDIGAIERISWARSERTSDPVSNRQEVDRDAKEAEASDTSDDRGEPPSFVFSGEAHRLRFVAYEPPRPSRPGPYILSYETSGTGRLQRSRHRFHPDIQTFDSLTFKDTVTVLDGPYRYRFSYGEMVSGKDGISEAWRWFPNWPHTNKLPALIKLEVRRKRSNALALSPIVVSPRIDAEPACARNRKTSSGCTVTLSPKARSEAGREAADDDK